MGSKEAVSVTHADKVEDIIKVTQTDPVGTVRLIDHNAVVLIPTPSPDPRGNDASKLPIRLLTRARSIEPPTVAQMGHNLHSQSL